MTRRQVRSAMRRMREAHAELEEETVEINLVPYMDIVTNIIIFLLASVVNAIPLGNVNVSLPAIGDGVASEQTDQPEKPPLNLTITAGERGFLIAASGGVLPTVPKKGDKYDFKQLTTKLEEIKKEYPDETQVKFNADATIPYRTVIETLDAMRMDAKGNMLFPDVNFAAGIL